MERKIEDYISIFSLYHRAMDMYDKYYRYEKIEGSQRVEKEIIPKEAFRETLASALVHRQWDVNSRIRITMFPDRIEMGLSSKLCKLF